MHSYRSTNTEREHVRPRCTQARTHRSSLMMAFGAATLLECLPCTEHCAGHHTHVTSLDSPKHLPTTSEASSIVIPILQMKEVRHREVRGHTTSARAWSPHQGPQGHEHTKANMLRHTMPRSRSTYTKRYTAGNTEPCHYIKISKHASKEPNQNP